MCVNEKYLAYNFPVKIDVPDSVDLYGDQKCIAGKSKMYRTSTAFAHRRDMTTDPGMHQITNFCPPWHFLLTSM